MTTAVQRYKKAIDEVRELYMLIGYIYRKDNYTPEAWEPNMIIDYLKYLKGNFADEIKAEITSGTNSKKDVIFRLDVVFSELGKLSDDISFFTPFDFWATDKRLFDSLVSLRGETCANEIIKAIDEVISVANVKINDVRFMLERLCEWCCYNSNLAKSQEPSTERAKKAFEMAVKAGMMEKTNTGYKWLYDRGSKASLGYFLVKVYNPDRTTKTPFKALNNIFGVTRIDSAADRAINEIKVDKPQKWRKSIDELLKEL